jgi:F-type H+-transporting ATPase subunit b
MYDVLILASTEAHGSEESAGLFQALGVNLQLLITQAIAFLILVFILGKFVYPVLMKAVDDRRDQIEAGLKEAKEAEEALATAEAKVADMLADARKEADGILARTHQETSAMVAEAETKAKDRAEQIVKDARAQLDTDVARARQTLKQETIQLVAQATEKIVGEKLDTSKDSGLIASALQDKA